ncbi:tetratricopeptide repeat protein [Phocaeicola coprocola DSM 17136]|uniref:Tetratricopeptide repeat protein n=1 Tax=Phocaeicola coprocola DSM 17136 TaxID=470145 RepID=B3JFX8_9BACT|nr:tetratricopeptide repeat protein [Phocaeicola coprocola]EDV02118.1 tetratricopeptide repeat protein [Phocaeicola coprocola DSM 17136]
MKKTAYFLLLLLLIGACGCRNRKTSYPPLIRQAEYWAEACPDSAIACLDSIDASLQELTEEERMYCHMLRIKAEDKLYIPHTSDSLINRIVRFYEQQGDDRRLAEALYYKAGVYRDCNEPSRAIRTYLSAAEVGCEHDTLNGRIYGQLAVLYAYQKAYHESMKALRQALVYNIKCDDYLGIAYSWRDMARIFDRQYSPDSAEVYYSKAYNLMKEKGFTRPAYGVLSEWADFSYAQGRHNTAKAFAYKILGDHFDELAALVLAKYYWQKNNLDSALFYSVEALQTNDIYHHRTAYGILKEIALSQGKQEDAHRYARCYREVSDSISRMTRTEATVRISYEAEKLDLLSHMKRLRYILALALTLLVAGMIYMGRNTHIFHKKQRLNKELTLEENSQVTLSEKQQSLEERLEAFQQSAIYLHFCRVTQSRELSEDHWRQLVNALNKVYPTFISKLYNLNPKLTELELRTCCLIKIGISTNRISALIAHSPSAVNSILPRLYHKMTGEKTNMSVAREFLKRLE